MKNRNGFIKLTHEAISLLEGKSEALHLYIIMLQHTAHKTYTNKKGIVLNVGECCLSYEEMSDLMLYKKNIKNNVKNISKIRRLLATIKATGLTTVNETKCRHRQTTVYKMHEKPYTVHINNDRCETMPTYENDIEKPFSVGNKTDIESDTLKSVDFKDFKELKEEEEEDTTTCARISYFDVFYTAYGKMLTPMQIQKLNSFMDEGLTDKQICESIEIASQVTSNVNYLYAILKNLLMPRIEKNEKGKSLKGAINNENGKRYIEGFDW